jgi:hypothetical protein
MALSNAEKQRNYRRRKADGNVTGVTVTNVTILKAIQELTEAVTLLLARARLPNPLPEMLPLIIQEVGRHFRNAHEMSALLPLDGSPDKEERVSPAPLPKEETNPSLIPLFPNLIRSLDSELEELWPLFRRKVGKLAACRAYRTARKQASFDTILTALRKAAIEWQTIEMKFIPHPARWFNAGHWLDEEETQTNGHDPECEIDPAEEERRREAGRRRAYEIAGIPLT